LRFRVGGEFANKVWSIVGFPREEVQFEFFDRNIPFLIFLVRLLAGSTVVLQGNTSLGLDIEQELVLLERELQLGLLILRWLVVEHRLLLAGGLELELLLLFCSGLEVD
jgi:hypothetical protein